MLVVRVEALLLEGLGLSQIGRDGEYKYYMDCNLYLQTIKIPNIIIQLWFLSTLNETTCCAVLIPLLSPFVS